MAGTQNETRESKIIALEDAIRDVKIAAADRGDVVVDLREASKARLELLADALVETISSVPSDDDQFDFAISSGQNPRFFIDATSHVGLARDKMTYRFLRDTRHGRVILGESRTIDTIADHVTRYIAERIVERQRMMEGDVTSALDVHKAPSDESGTTSLEDKDAKNDGMSDFMLGLIWFLIGSVAGSGLLYLWLTQNLQTLPVAG